MSLVFQTRLALTEAQCIKLLKGEGIRITSDMTQKGLPILLTKSMAKKHDACLQTGKGFILKMPQTHLKKMCVTAEGHHLLDSHVGGSFRVKHDSGELMTGSGFWSRLWRGIKKVGKAVYTVVKPVLRPALNAVIQTVPGLQQAVDVGKSVLEQIPGGQTVIDGVNTAVTGVVGSSFKPIGGSFRAIGSGLKKPGFRVLSDTQISKSIGENASRQIGTGCHLQYPSK